MRRVAAGLGIAVLVTASAALAGGPLSGAVSADQDSGRCTLRTLKGTYVFEARGVLKDGASVVPYAEAGTWTLDGAGHAQGVFSASLNGVTIASQKPLTATYQHKGGCVYTAVDSENLSFDLYLTNQGDTMTYFTAGVSGSQFRR
jgi:hypothetical protein